MLLLLYQATCHRLPARRWNTTGARYSKICGAEAGFVISEGAAKGAAYDASGKASIAQAFLPVKWLLGSHLVSSPHSPCLSSSALRPPPFQIDLVVDVSLVLTVRLGWQSSKRPLLFFNRRSPASPIMRRQKQSSLDALVGCWSSS